MRRDGLCDVLRIVLPLDCGIVDPAAPPTDNGRTGPAPPQPAGPSTQPLAELPAQSSPSTVRYEPGRLAVAFVPGTTARRAARVLANTGVEVEQATPAIAAYLVRVEPSRREATRRRLLASPAVLSADREPIASVLETIPSDPLWPQAWGLQLAGFPAAWDLSRGSPRLVVAVVDTGVDPTQPELKGALVPGYDFVNSDADPRDDHGHGTAVAGVIAARADNATGTTGACWRCAIMPIKVLGADGVGDDSLIAAGIIWAADHGARVINLSLGGPGTTQVLAEAIAYATAKGALVVGAAGNSGTSVPFYPAADANALSVAGTTRNDKPYEWTNRGDWVDVAAPGCNPTIDRGERYVVFCGTSAATPLVAGLAALALSRSAELTPQALEQQIEGAALPLPGLVRYGRLRAGQTLASLTGLAAAPRVERRSLAGATSARRRTRTYDLAVGGGPLSVQLTTSGNAKLTLSLLLPGRRRALKRSGRGVVRIATKTAPGSLRLAVTGSGGKHAFMLTVDFQTAT
jgi:subtilisin family serine protease